MKGKKLQRNIERQVMTGRQIDLLLIYVFSLSATQPDSQFTVNFISLYLFDLFAIILFFWVFINFYLSQFQVVAIWCNRDTGYLIMDSRYKKQYSIKKTEYSQSD